MLNYLLDRTCIYRSRVWLTQLHDLGGALEQDIEISVMEVSWCLFSFLCALSTFMCVFLCFPSHLVPWEVAQSGLNRQCPVPGLVGPMRNPRMILEGRRRESQAICVAGPLIRNTDDSALGQNCFSSLPIDLGGTSEHLMETCLGKIGESFLKTKVDTLSKEYYICYFQICVGHRWRQPQPEAHDSYTLPEGKKRYKDQNFLGTFSPPTFSFTFPAHSSQDSFLCTFLELEGVAHEPDLI